MSRYHTYFGTLVGLVCVYFVVRSVFLTDLTTRNVPGDILTRPPRQRTSRDGDRAQEIRLRSLEA
ncbi:MAG TPA: hypothetical protein VL652_12065 [Kutzneria sp.]|nr:hypothetical protein [Kutzneria sp.]